MTPTSNRTMLCLVVLAGCDTVFGVEPPQTPEAGIDAVFPDSDAEGDLDGDGVLNAMDNCIDVLNPAQHDEDRDAVGDACDPCPYLGGGATDTDGDTVGDLCDPDPSSPRERLQFFLPFDEATSYVCNDSPEERLACVTPADDTVVVPVVNDRLLLASPIQFVVEHYAKVDIRRLAVAVQVSTDLPDTNFVRILGRGNAGSFQDNYVMCGVTRDAGNDRAYLTIHHHIVPLTYGTASMEMMPWSMLPPRIELALDIPQSADAVATCRVSWSGGSLTGTIPLPVEHRPKTFGVWTMGMQRSEVEYIAVTTLIP